MIRNEWTKSCVKVIFCVYETRIIKWVGLHWSSIDSEHDSKSHWWAAVYCSRKELWTLTFMWTFLDPWNPNLDDSVPQKKLLRTVWREQWPDLQILQIFLQTCWSESSQWRPHLQPTGLKRSTNTLVLETPPPISHVIVLPKGKEPSLNHNGASMDHFMEAQSDLDLENCKPRWPQIHWTVPDVIEVWRPGSRFPEEHGSLVFTSAVSEVNVKFSEKDLTLSFIKWWRCAVSQELRGLICFWMWRQRSRVAVHMNWVLKAARRHVMRWDVLFCPT